MSFALAYDVVLCPDAVCASVHVHVYIPSFVYVSACLSRNSTSMFMYVCVNAYAVQVLRDVENCRGLTEEQIRQICWDVSEYCKQMWIVVKLRGVW